MDKDSHAILSSIQGLLGITSIIIGLCSRRFKTAFIWGTIVGSLWAMVLIAAVISVVINGDYLESSGYITGRIVAPVIVMGLLGLLGHSIRWCLGAVFRLFRKSPTQSPG